RSQPKKTIPTHGGASGQQQSAIKKMASIEHGTLLSSQTTSPPSASTRQNPAYLPEATSQPYQLLASASNSLSGFKCSAIARFPAAEQAA
ncbi:hypothetical protein, partial [Sinomonas sp. ASV322]|uniref:hypothetical protein n=1 Tax=Sinomonas sp. ASV322 TaxID=3041920 RepID=UPI0027DC1E47